MCSLVLFMKFTTFIAVLQFLLECTASFSLRLLDLGGKIGLFSRKVGVTRK
jgi:hypothetical protein